MARRKKTIKETVLLLLPKLSENEFKEIAQYVEINSFQFQLEKLQADIQETRYAKGHFTCPICHGSHIVKNGKMKNGNQRYQCRDCRKSFSNQTSTPSTRSKKSPQIWLKYIQCMMLGYSIRKAAEECGLNIATSFFWRHKILDALFSAMGEGFLDGLLEADETFFRYNRKGNRTKERSYKAGVSVSKAVKSKRTKKQRGLSGQQVAVGTAMDRNGNMKFGLICTGRLQYSPLKRFFEGYIEPQSTICTDSAHGYSKLSKELNLNHIQIESGRRKKDIYHIQHINSLHGRLKTFMKKFNGVSTKHLQNYLNWFKFIELFKHEREPIKIEKAYTLAQAAYTDCTVDKIKTRVAAFV